MRTVGVFEAKTRLSALLREVADGGVTLITRRGKPIARLIAAEPAVDRAKALRAAAGLRQASKGKALGGLSLKALIAEGRR